jgi:hypothetical protein
LVLYDPKANKNETVRCSSNQEIGKCLPQDKILNCSPYVGIPVLINDQFGNLAWHCKEKYPNIVKRNNYDGDVTRVVACNGLGQLVHPTSRVPWSSERNYTSNLATCECSTKGTFPGDKNEYRNFQSCVSDTY